jgi:hypothetical protein
MFRIVMFQVNEEEAKMDELIGIKRFELTVDHEPDLSAVMAAVNHPKRVYTKRKKGGAAA